MEDKHYEYVCDHIMAMNAIIARMYVIMSMKASSKLLLPTRLGTTYAPPPAPRHQRRRVQDILRRGLRRWTVPTPNVGCWDRVS